MLERVKHLFPSTTNHHSLGLAEIKASLTKEEVSAYRSDLLEVRRLKGEQAMAKGRLPRDYRTTPSENTARYSLARKLFNQQRKIEEMGLVGQDAGELLVNQGRMVRLSIDPFMPYLSQLHNNEALIRLIQVKKKQVGRHQKKTITWHRQQAQAALTKERKAKREQQKLFKAQQKERQKLIIQNPGLRSRYWIEDHWPIAIDQLKRLSNFSRLISSRIYLVGDEFREIYQRITTDPRQAIFSLLNAGVQTANPGLPVITSALIASMQNIHPPAIVKPFDLSLTVKASETISEPLQPGREMIPKESTIGQLLNRKIDIKEAVVQIIDQPTIHFADQTGREISSFYRVLNFPQASYPEKAKLYLTGIEGKWQAPLAFYSRLLGRNGLVWLTKIISQATQGKITLDPLRANSGVSDPTTSLTEMMAGFFPPQVLLNPEKVQGIHNPEAYLNRDLSQTADYLRQLIKVDFDGHLPTGLDQQLKLVSDPSTLQEVELPENQVRQYLALAAAKIESRLVANELIKAQGEETCLSAYLDVLPLANRDGLPVFGLAAGLKAYLNVDLNQANDGQIIAILAGSQAPDLYFKNQSDLINRSNVCLDSLVKKGVVDSKQALTIKEQIDGLELLLHLPADVNNSWLDQPEFSKLPLDIRESVHQVIASVQKQRGNKEISLPFPIQISKDGSIVHVLLPSPALPEAVPLPTIDLSQPVLKVNQVEQMPQQPRLNEFISTRLTERENDYVFITDDKRQIPIPKFYLGNQAYPGLSIALYDVTDKQMLSVFDQTNLLSRNPYALGSALKVFFLKFLESKGIGLDRVYPNLTGLHPMVVNQPKNGPPVEIHNSVAATNVPFQISLREALAKSLNGPFMAAYVDLWKTDPKLWQEMQTEFSRLGITLTDIKGNKLDQPTLYAAIGTDALVPSQRQVVEALARVIIESSAIRTAMADQPAREKLLPIGLGIWSRQMLNDLNPDLIPGNPKIVAGFKTGTAPFLNIISNDNTLGYVSLPDGRVVVMAVRVAGQNKQGQTVDVGADAASIALPIARAVLKEAVNFNYSNPEITSPQEVVENLLLMREKGKNKDNYRQAVVKKEMIVYDRFDHPIDELKEGETVLALNKGEKGKREIAYCPLPGQVTTALVDKEDLTVNVSEKYQGETALKLQQLDNLVSTCYGPDVVSPNLNYLVVNEDDKSPLSLLLLNMLNTSRQLMAGPEVLAGFFQALGLPNSTVVVNGVMLESYLGKNETVDRFNLNPRQETLISMIAGQGEWIKFNRIINESRTGVAFASLLWQNGQFQREATPAHRLLTALANYPPDSIILHSERLDAPAIIKGASYNEPLIKEIVSLYYDRLANRSIISRDAARFVTLLQLLNAQPSSSVLEQLAIPVK